MINKLASLALALYCLITAFSLEGAAGLTMLIVIIPLLACIWFSELLGSLTGFGGFRHPVVDKQTPGCLVSAMGWLGLLVVTIATTKRLM
jgi:hypothetical protein